MSGIEAWKQDGTQVIYATDQLGVMGGSVDISYTAGAGGASTGSVYSPILKLGEPWYLYINNENYFTYFPQISIDKASGTLSWNGSSGYHAGTIYYGTY